MRIHKDRIEVLKTLKDLLNERCDNDDCKYCEGSDNFCVVLKEEAIKWVKDFQRAQKIDEYAANGYWNSKIEDLI